MIISEKLYQIRIKLKSEEEAEIYLQTYSLPWSIEENESGIFLNFYSEYIPDSLKDKDVEICVLDSSWSESYKKYFNGAFCGGFFIRPPWMKPKAGFKNIIIYPSTGFGTGEHPTTCGMLKIIDFIFDSESGLKVLDVGTGSGILSIAAMFSGASTVVAIDKDPLAIKSARINLKLNRLWNRIVLCNCSLDALGNGSFDLVMANLDFFQIVANVRTFLNLAVKGGYILISGFLKEDIDTVEKIYSRCGLSKLKEMCINDWVTLLFRVP